MKIEDLEKLSRFEINKLVGFKVGAIRKGKTDRYYGNYCPDYCNSWADMGPIAMDNNIVITPCMGTNKGDATGYFEHENPVCSEFSDNKEALRAAAIVYLMMDKENEI